MRKIRLSDVENRVMRILREAGEETWPTVLATLRFEAGYNNETSIATAVKHLVALGFVQQDGASLILTERGQQTLQR